MAVTDRAGACAAVNNSFLVSEHLLRWFFSICDWIIGSSCFVGVQCTWCILHCTGRGHHHHPAGHAPPTLAGDRMTRRCLTRPEVPRWASNRARRRPTWIRLRGIMAWPRGRTTLSWETLWLEISWHHGDIMHHEFSLPSPDRYPWWTMLLPSVVLALSRKIVWPRCFMVPCSLASWSAQAMIYLDDPTPQCLRVCRRLQVSEFWL